MDPVFDSFGSVDPIGIRTRISFVANIHTADSWCHGAQVAQGNGHQTLAPNLRVWQEIFLKPRGEFYMSFGEAVWFHVLPFNTSECDKTAAGLGGAEIDIAHGPRTTLKVLQVNGTHSVKAQMTVEFVTATKCPSSYLKWLNLRYVVDEDIDCVNGWIRSRTYRGRFRVGGISPDVKPHVLAREIAVPPLQRGFQRQNIQFAPTENELEFNFRFTDKEKMSQPPAPACNWDGEFALELPNGEVITESNLRFSLTADPTVERRFLFNLAQRIIELKLNWTSRRGDLVAPTKIQNTIFVTNASFSESLADNRVSASVRVRNTDGLAYLVNMRMAGYPGSKNMLGIELPDTANDGTPWASIKHDPKVMFPTPSTFADVTGLFMCALQTPCCPQRMPYSEGTASTEVDEFKVYDTVTSNLVDADSEVAAQYSTQHTETGMYQWYKLSSEHLGDTGWRGTPRGMPCITSTDSATLAFAQIHCPVSARRIRIHAARVNAWPQLPRIENWRDRFGILHVLGQHRIEPQPPALSVDARDALYEVYAEYYYYMERPPNVSKTGSEGILSGVLPYTTNQVITTQRSVISADKFVDPKDILDLGLTQ